MSEATTYSFDLKEVTTALLLQQGIHEGLWQLSFEFNFGAGLVGATKEEVRPSAFMQIQRLQLVRQPEGADQQPFVVNAADVNPATSTGRSAHKDRKPKQ
jgi:hypothetical protein